MNIILSLFEIIYAIIKAIIDMHYYIMKNLRRNFLDKTYKEYNISNIFSLLIKIIILSIYESLVFHIYIFIYLIIRVNIGPFGIFLRFILTISVSCLLAFISGEIKQIFHYLYHLILSVFHLFTFLIALCFFIITWNKELKDMLLFKKQFTNFYEISEIYYIIILQLYRFLLIIPHLTNLFSIIRLYELYKNKNEPNSSTLTKSFFHIFFDIIVLTPGYIFVLILPPVFISMNINICKTLNQSKENEDDEFPKYNIIKNQIINDMVKVVIYIIAIVLNFLSILFIWKLDKNAKNLIQLFKTNEYEKFFKNYFDNIFNGSYEIIYLFTNIIAFIINILLMIFAIPFFWKWNKFYENWKLLIKTKEYRKYLANYFSILSSCIIDIINLIMKIIMLLVCTLLTILALPFIWKFKIFFKNLIELYKVGEYSKFFHNYCMNISECFNQIYNFFKKIFLTIFLIIFLEIFSYLIFAIKTIINAILITFIYLVATILTIIAIPFFWKLNELIHNSLDLFKTKDYSNFFISYCNILINAIKELFNFLIKITLTIIKFIIYSIPMILNHLSIIHLKTLYDCYYRLNKKEKKEKEFLKINMIIFFEKWLDIFTFILSIFRIININFYFHLLHQKCDGHFFDLLFNNENMIKYYSNKEMRLEIIRQLIDDISISILMILQILLGILNPFTTLKIIKNIILYFITCKNQTNVKFAKIENEFIDKSIKTIINLLFIDFIYLPISILFNILAFWTIKYNISLFISNNKKSLSKFRNINNKSINYISEKNIIDKMFELKNIYPNNLYQIFKSMIAGYILIFRGIIIILNFFRIFILFYKFRRNKKVNNYKLIKEQYDHAIIELVYIPFILIMSILQPWNYEIIKEFFKAKNCGDKFNKFANLFFWFFIDLFFIFIFLLLMITLIDAMPALFLVIRSTKRKFFPSEQNKLTYALKYKTEKFRVELMQIYNKNVKKIVTAFLFILNILLISRIKPLFQRTWPFFKQFFNKMRTNIKKIFSCNKKSEIEDDNLTSMPLIIISEICKFLEVNEVNNLNHANKKLKEKTDINYIWENIYNNKYDKILKEVLDEKEYKDFSKMYTENYKESCKNSYITILSKKGRALQKNKTFGEIVREETINSLSNLSYLLLSPIYIPIYVTKYTNIILFKIYNFITTTFDIPKYYDRNGINKLNENNEFFLFLIIKRVLYIIFQLIMICFATFMISQFFMRYIFTFLSFILYKINQILFDILRIKIFYEKTLVINSYEYHETSIISNIIGIFHIIKQLLIIIYIIFLVPQFLLKYILRFLNLILYNIYEFLSNLFAIKKIYEKDLITEVNADKITNPIIVNLKGIAILIMQIVVIAYYIFLIPQIFLRYIIKMINTFLNTLYEFLINKLKINRPFEKLSISESYMDKDLNPIIANIEGILYILIQIALISYFLFLIPQIILSRFVLKYLNLYLYKIYNFFIVKFSFKQIYEKSLVTEIYVDKTLNPIIANIRGILVMIIQIIIICYLVFLVLQIILRLIFININLIFYKINDFLSTKFIIKRFYEKTLITNIYDDKSLNPIIVNIKGIFIMVFQIIIFSYYLFILPQIFLRYIFEILNSIIYRIYVFLINTFVIIKLYEKELITNIYEDKTFNPIIANIKGIFILIFQIIILAYTIILIPQIILIKILSCSFNNKSTDLSLDIRVQDSSFLMILIQLIYGIFYFIINYTICILPSLYYIFIDLDLKSKSDFNQTIKDLANIIYFSTMKQFTQIFFGKYYLNIILYFINKLLIKHTVIYLSETTDIIFVKILANLYSEFYKIPISIYFPLKYFLKYIGISFKAISIKNKNVSKMLEILLNVLALTICIIPFYLLYVCFENDSKKILFIEVPAFIYLVFNMWICGRAITDIEKQYGAF